MFCRFLFLRLVLFFRFFFFNDTATTEIYTLSLHDALPISFVLIPRANIFSRLRKTVICRTAPPNVRSEEHTSELQSHSDLVCRLLLEKKKNKHRPRTATTTTIGRQATTRRRSR